jgi:NADPH2:quinone reductase
MRALLCSELGPASKLSIAEVDDPHPGPGEVVIGVVAAGLNFPDTLIIEGKYQTSPALPFSPGGEAAGEVVEIGEGVTGVSPGDWVIGMSTHGAFAERWVVPATSVLPIPAGLDTAAAAGFALTYGTAYHAFKQRAALRSGETILVLGAAGGVGSAAVELGKAMGARVIAAASTPEKLRFCRSLGADELVDYGAEPLRDRLRDLTAGRGVDVVFDPVGGELTETAFRSLAWNGRHLVIGFAAGEIPSLPANLALLKGAALVGVFWGRSLGEEPAAAFENFVELAAMVGDGRIAPRVWREFRLDEYEEAFGVFARREVMGKAVFRLR